MSLLLILSRDLHGVHIDEESLQDRIAQSLVNRGFKFAREYRLSPRDRIDFYLPEILTGIEVKVAGNASSLNRQVGRYAMSNKLERIIVVTTKRTHVSCLVKRVNGKPVEAVVVERGLC